MTSYVFVHRYKWSHDALRRRARKLLKAGQIEVVGSNNLGWLYKGPTLLINRIKRG